MKAVLIVALIVIVLLGIVAALDKIFWKTVNKIDEKD